MHLLIITSNINLDIFWCLTIFQKCWRTRAIIWRFKIRADKDYRWAFKTDSGEFLKRFVFSSSFCRSMKEKITVTDANTVYLPIRYKIVALLWAELTTILQWVHWKLQHSYSLHFFVIHHKHRATTHIEVVNNSGRWAFRNLNKSAL